MVAHVGTSVRMDPTHMSFPVVARMIHILMSGLLGDVSSLFVMNQPTNIAWFDEWVAYLRSQGVTIATDVEVEDFVMQGGQVSSVLLKNKKLASIF